MSRGHSLALIAAFSLIAACDQDPLGLSERTIVGDYRLKQWEDGTTYYLEGGSHAENGGGAIDGTIVRIGWDQRTILVERHATFRGDGDGYMVIDVRQQTIRGPLSQEIVSSNPDLAGIKLMAPAEAWATLGR